MIYTVPRLGYTVLDGSGSGSTFKLSLSHGVTVASAMAAGNTLRGLLAPLTGCTFVRQSVTYHAINDAAGPADPGSLAKNLGLFVFETSSPDQLAAIRVPGIRPNLIKTTGPNAGLELDETLAPIQAFLAAMLMGDWCNPFGYDLVSLGATLVESAP